MSAIPKKMAAVCVHVAEGKVPERRVFPPRSEGNDSDLWQILCKECEEWLGTTPSHEEMVARCRIVEGAHVAELTGKEVGNGQ